MSGKFRKRGVERGIRGGGNQKKFLLKMLCFLLVFTNISSRYLLMLGIFFGAHFNENQKFVSMSNKLTLILAQSLITVFFLFRN